VTLEIDGCWLRVTKERPDGTTKLELREFTSQGEARRAGDDAAHRLIAHGYRERNDRVEPAGGAPSTRMAAPSKAPVPSKAPAPSKAPVPSKAPAPMRAPDLNLLEEAGEYDADTAEPALARTTPASDLGPKKKPAKKKKKKKRKSAKATDELDKRVIAGIAATGLLFVGFLGFLAYDAFLKPPSIIGHWEGSRTEHEIGKFLRNTEYRLILDERGRVSMAMGEGTPTTGTYAFAGDRLKLTLKDDDGETSELQYKAELGRSTLDLYDEGGRKLVQLIRFRKNPVVGAGKSKPAAPENLALGAEDKEADQRLASVRFAVKDGAFGLRHPAGWEVDSGARPDNSYSWAKITKGSAKIRVFADVTGSLMAGPNLNNHEEGSELAPVHGAHERYSKDAAELYSKYAESKPAAFKGSGLGEGRIATFKATEGSVFGTEVRGIRVTLLTNDRRISVLCDAPSKEFDALLPTFLATCRSLSR
jgi:hypothetical protein